MRMAWTLDTEQIPALATLMDMSVPDCRLVLSSTIGQAQHAPTSRPAQTTP